MKIKLTLLEKEIMGIGVYRISYQTNIRLDERPDSAALVDRIEERVLTELGSSREEAAKDRAYSMDLILKKQLELGLSVPGDRYTLVITSGGSIKRLVKQIIVEEAV